MVSTHTPGPNPPSPSLPSAPPPRARLGGCLGLLAGLAAGAVLTLALLLTLKSTSPMRSLWSALRGTTTLDMSQPTVVQKIQQLQRLETVVYSMDKVVSGGHDSPLLPDFLGADRILMLVHGESVAGIDFSALRPGDVKVEGKRGTLHLPEPRSSPPASTARAPASTPAKPAGSSPPTPISKPKSARKPSARSRKRRWPKAS